MAVYQFLGFKDLYIQTNLSNKFLKKLHKTMNFDLHTWKLHIIHHMFSWEIMYSLFKNLDHVLTV